MIDTVLDARVSGRSSREGMTDPVAGRCKRQAYALAAALLFFAGGGGRKLRLR